MTQQRSVATAENGRDAFAMWRDARIPYCVDTMEERMKPARSKGMPESSVRIPQRPQLTNRDNPVLLPCLLRQLMVTSPFWAHTDR